LLINEDEDYRKIKDLTTGYYALIEKEYSVKLLKDLD
jgi:hypothetical protein